MQRKTQDQEDFVRKKEKTASGSELAAGMMRGRSKPWSFLAIITGSSESSTETDMVAKENSSVAPALEDVPEQVGLGVGRGPSDVLAIRNHILATKEKSWKQLAVERAKVVLPLLLFVVVLLVLAPVYLKDHIVALQGWAEENQPNSTFIYIGVRTLFFPMCLPVAPLGTAAGFIFGFWIAYGASIVGNILGALLQFFLVRVVFAHFGVRDRIRVWAIENYLEVRVLNDLMYTEPFRILLLFKVSIIPSWLKTYLFAALDAPFHKFMIVHVFTSLLFVPLFTGIGASAGDLVDALDGKNVNPVFGIVNIVVPGLVTLGTMFYLKRKFQQVIDEYVQEHLKEEEREGEEAEGDQKLDEKLEQTVLNMRSTTPVLYD